MGWINVVSAAVLVGGIALAAVVAANRDRPEAVPEVRVSSIEQVRAEEVRMPVAKWTPRTTGSALSRAAFGLSALQPETYNGEIVLDIIDASPLEGGEKDRLSAKLLAAEAGHAELPQVLEDIRLALAVE